MPTDTAEPRTVVARYAADLLRELTARAGRMGPVRVTDAASGLACMVLVWATDARMPTASGEQPPPSKSRGGRERCREDILAAVRAAGRLVTRKEVVRALRTAGPTTGPGRWPRRWPT